MNAKNSPAPKAAPAPSESLTAADYAYVADLLKRQSGLDLGSDKAYLLKTRLQPVAEAHSFASVGQLVSALRKESSRFGPLSKAVVEAMATHESLFFRDVYPFEILVSRCVPEILADAARPKKPVRVWSAACSVGQEPYSLLMALDGLPSLSQGDYEIVGTDFADHAVERCKAAKYTAFEVQRGLSPAQRKRYFDEEQGGAFRVKEAYRKRVSFQKLNLLGGYASVGMFDVIFCRNVLIYFDKADKSAVLDRLAGSLNPGGYLFLGGAETCIGLSTAFERVEGISYPVFRKKRS